MATISYTETATENINVKRVSWLAMTNSGSDVGTAIDMQDYSDCSVQVTGTLGTGGTVRIEGSLDGGATYHVLTDPQGNNLDVNALKIEAITEFAGKIRPRITAGDGTTSLNVYMLMRGLRNG